MPLFGNEIKSLRKYKIDRLTAEVAKLREIAEHYAAQETWRQDWNHNTDKHEGSFEIYDSDDFENGYDFARTKLKEIEDENISKANLS